jgi:hypothetical protein
MSLPGRKVGYVALAVSVIAASVVAAFAQAAVASSTPTISIGDGSVVNGSGGTRTIYLPVTLSQPGSTTATVQYQLQDGSATGGTKAGPGVDYNNLGGVIRTLTFTASAITHKTPVVKQIAVIVYRDAASDADEHFQVTLANASAGWTIGRSVGTGTIIGSDASSAPELSIGDSTISEGDVGNRTVDVPVTLSVPAPAPITVQYAIADGTAHCGNMKTGKPVDPASDCYNNGGATKTLTFALGQRKKLLPAIVFPNTLAQPDRSFTIHLSHPTAAVIRRGVGTVTILDDDAPTISRVSPATGPLLGNTVITLTGTGFSDVTQVTFGGFVGTILKQVSNTQMTVTDPSALTTGPVDVVVTRADGSTSAISPADVFTYVDGPGGFPATITGTIDGSSSINPHPQMPESTWNTSFTLQYDPTCAAAALASGNTVACYTATDFNGAGTHAWYSDNTTNEVCTVPFNFDTSGSNLGAYIQSDANGNYHLYFYLETVNISFPTCSEGTEASNVQAGAEHLNDNSDTLSPDGYQIGQTTLTQSGHDAGGDGLSGDGTSAPGWSANVSMNFAY